MLRKTIKSIIAGSLAIIVGLVPISAYAGTTNDTNHPYTIYSYTTTGGGNANGSYVPGTSVSRTSQSHEHELVWVDDNGNVVTDCTTSTTKHLACKTCNYRFAHGVAAYAAIGHQYNESSWVIDKEPTCTETGMKHQVCRVCGGGETNYTEIPKLEHEYKKATATENGGIKSLATCSSNAVYYQVCAHCGEVSHEHYNEIEGTMLKHNYVRGTCTDCGKHCSDIWQNLRSWLRF